MDNVLILQYTIVEEIFNALVGLYIIVKSVFLIFRVSKSNNYIQEYDNIKWLKVFIVLGGFVFLFWVFAIIIHVVNDTNFAYMPLRIDTSVLLYWIAYQGLYRYQVTEDRIFLRQHIKTPKAILSSIDTKVPESGDLKNGLDNFKKIDDYILLSLRFLDPNLSMELLAKELQMSTSYLSKVVNTHSNSNFSDYINFYRVEQAKKLLCNPTFDNYTILSIALECGFSSKSTFYEAFKKFTNQTPSQFKLEH